MKTWIILLTLAFATPASANWITNGDFSAWSGASYKASCSEGHWSADAIWVGPGYGGCVATMRLSPCSSTGGNGHCLMLNLYQQAVGGQDPRTWRPTILEHHIWDGGLLAGRKVRFSFNAFSDRQMVLIPILWQNWRTNVYQIYTCPTVWTSPNAWARASCEMTLPYTTAIPLEGYYTGVGIDTPSPTVGIIVLDGLSLEVIE